LYGIDNLPDEGSLLVGNHTIYGFLDLPFMMAEVWKRRRIAIRGLGEHAHYAVPVWRDLLGACGMVRGTRDNVRALMRDHQTILVFPGGAREVNKRRGQQYQLLWGERMGFARLAIEQGYPIVPVAAVGAEDMLNVVADVQTPVYGQFARLTKKVTGFPAPPIVRGLGLTPIPALRGSTSGSASRSTPPASRGRPRTLPPARSGTKPSRPSWQASSSCATSATRIPIAISPSACSTGPSDERHDEHRPARPFALP
jgi:Diacylglycerol acyltransferase